MRVFLQRLFAAVLLGALLGAGAAARAADAGQAPSSPPPVISLVTFGPGPVYWERFGHNAILVDDIASGSLRLYNYGMFDFHQENFFLNFARGLMRYRLAEQSWLGALSIYAADSRWAYLQQLDLDARQARSLADYLAWNARAENAEYRYDYFTANCSTRVRDAIDDASGGALRRHAQAQASPRTYRFEATRLIAPEPALALAMDLGMGPRADAPLTQWELSFVPMTLMEAVRGARLTHADGSTHALVKHEGWVLRSDRWPEPAAPPRWLGLAAIAGLASAALLVLLGRQRAQRGARISLSLLTATFCLVSALLGGVLLLGAFATEHQVMMANRNLLLLNPLSLLLLPACLRLAWRDAFPAQATTWLAALITFGAAMTPLLALLPQTQFNLPWIALLLPLHAALAWTLLSARAAAYAPLPR